MSHKILPEDAPPSPSTTTIPGHSYFSSATMPRPRRGSFATTAAQYLTIGVESETRAPILLFSKGFSILTPPPLFLRFFVFLVVGTLQPGPSLYLPHPTPEMQSVESLDPGLSDTPNKVRSRSDLNVRVYAEEDGTYTQSMVCTKKF